MMSKNLFKILLILGLFFCTGSKLFAQTADTTQTNSPQNTSGGNQVLDIGESLIKIQIEKPQVQLFSQRVKPEFGDVDLEKSFLNEILNKDSKLDLQFSKTNNKNRINVQEMIKRQR